MTDAEKKRLAELEKLEKEKPPKKVDWRKEIESSYK